MAGYDPVMFSSSTRLVHHLNGQVALVSRECMIKICKEHSVHGAMKPTLKWKILEKDSVKSISLPVRHHLEAMKNKWEEFFDVVRQELRQELAEEIRQKLCDELQEDVRHELRTEQRDNVRQELREDVRLELRLEQQEDVRHELREEQREDVRHELREAQREDVRHELRKEQREDVRHELRNEQREDVRYELREEEREDVRQELRKDLRHELREEQREDVRHELREEQREHVRQELREEQWEKVRHELRREQREDIRHELRKKQLKDVRQELREEQREAVRHELRKELREDVRQELRKHERQKMLLENKALKLVRDLSEHLKDPLIERLNRFHVDVLSEIATNMLEVHCYVHNSADLLAKLKENKIRFLFREFRRKDQFKDVVLWMRKKFPVGSTGPLNCDDEEKTEKMNFGIRREVSIRLNSKNCWETVASHRVMDLTIIDIRKFMKSENPAEEVISRWESKNKSTVGLLYDLLVDCELYNIADLL
ncbi:trichohyalin-like [Xenia sp. Carnegie-2017]|uniref:trichohyalin-like n=1 Tax=Xenia sp. Carnegie-2017 TaxID=2897299 RepID=UPI001F04CF06|nr:trichohyalin-like [Xenia sp. Carnegie-2017]